MRLPFLVLAIAAPFAPLHPRPSFVSVRPLHSCAATARDGLTD